MAQSTEFNLGSSFTNKEHRWVDDIFTKEYHSTEEIFDEEETSTLTSKEQIQVERRLQRFFEIFYKKAELDPEAPALNRDLHLHFLTNHLFHLPKSYECLDASRPWLCYWIVHSIVLFNQNIEKNDALRIAGFLKRCQNENGGFGGGPSQLSHLAPTYAAVNTLCSLAIQEAYETIDRKALKQFLWSVRQPDGSFAMHVGGEVDIRGLYCALSVARLTNIYSDDLFDLSAEWIVTCQTYEGGFSGAPGMEAHGGYAFCAVAALSLLRKEHLCDVKSLLRWTVNRQMRFEGGFQGRTNKLVDSCYSFWQGGAFPIIQRILCMQEDESGGVRADRWLFHSKALQQYILVCCQNARGGLVDKLGEYLKMNVICLLEDESGGVRADRWLFHSKALQQYILVCCQNARGGLVDKLGEYLKMNVICLLEDESGGVRADKWLFHSKALQQYILVCCQNARGGLVDKPPKPRDLYHTCYALSGLSVAQNQPGGKPNVLGSMDNILEPVHPLYNIRLSQVKPATDYFMACPVPP